MILFNIQLYFTGHRLQSLSCGFNEQYPACLKIKHQLKWLIAGLIEKKNVMRFIPGVAIGVDTWVAEIVIGLKSKYNALPDEISPDK